MGMTDIENEIYQKHFKKHSVEIKTWHQLFCEIKSFYNFSEDFYKRIDDMSPFEDRMEAFFFDHGISWNFFGANISKILEIGLGNYISSLEMIRLCWSQGGIVKFKSKNDFIERSLVFLKENQDDLVNIGRTKNNFPLSYMRNNFSQTSWEGMNLLGYRESLLVFKRSFLQQLGKSSETHIDYITILETISVADLSRTFTQPNNFISNYETILEWVEKCLDSYSLRGFPQAIPISEISDTIKKYISEDFVGISPDAQSDFLTREDYKAFFKTLSGLSRWRNDIGNPVCQELILAHEKLVASNKNEFRLVGDIWHLKYEGKLIKLRNSKGLRVIHFLLSNPGRSCALTQVSNAIGDHISDLNIPKWQENDPNNSRIITQEIVSAQKSQNNVLVKELKKMKNKRKKLNNEWETLRKSLSKNVQDAEDKIEAAHYSLGKYLSKTILTGHEMSYQPDDGINFLLK